MALENVTLPAGRSTTYHSHNQDLFFVIIKGAKIKNQVLGKDPVDIDFKQDNIYFANYTKTPGTHQITNVEPENTMWLLGMAIIHPEAGRFTPSSRPAKYEATLENERVRSWRLKLGLGETAPVIKQMAPGARFVVAGGDAVEKKTRKARPAADIEERRFHGAVAGRT